MRALTLALLILAYPVLRGCLRLSHNLAAREVPGLSFLARLYNSADRAVGSVLPGHITGIIWFYVMYLFLADLTPERGFANPNLDMAEGKSLWVELAFCLGLFGLSLRVMVSRHRRSELYRNLDEAGYFGFAVVVGLLVAINIANFALVTRLFPAGYLLDPPRRYVGVWDWFLFYLWQFLHTIPDLEFTEVIHWTVPLNYVDARLGVVVLAFKILVILPIITTAVGYWNFRHKEGPAGGSDGPAGGMATRLVRVRSRRRSTASGRQAKPVHVRRSVVRQVRTVVPGRTTGAGKEPTQAGHVGEGAAGHRDPRAGASGPGTEDSARVDG